MRTKRNLLSVAAPLASLLTLSFFPLRAIAQNSSSARGLPGTPSPAEVAATPKSQTDQDTLVTLSPFEVQADSDKSYGALNSNSITRFNVELHKLPISADILDQTFMDDVGAISVEAMISTYSAGGGLNVSSADTGAANNQPGDRNSNAYTQLRGLVAPTMQRNGFMPMTTFGSSGGTTTGYTTNFDIERVEIINGPQALLYGNGGAGGVVNLVSKQARLGQPTSGSILFRVDQYGSKVGQFDYGTGTDNLALRVAGVSGYEGGRRVFIGGRINGIYSQVAFKLLSNTVVRVEGGQSSYNRFVPTSLNLTALSAADDSRNGKSLRYLLATNQIDSSSSGPSGAGPIVNGNINWDNLYSYLGWWSSERTLNTQENLTAETKWSSWLSTQFAVGYRDFRNNLISSAGLTLYAPNVTANPLPGHWTITQATAIPATESNQLTRTKAIRFSALATNRLFGGRALSQTIVGTDFSRLDEAYVAYSYFQADGNFNVIVNPASAVNNGRTVIPRPYWAVDGGPIQYPFFPPTAPYFTWNGVNYVKALVNQVDPKKQTKDNPLGVTLGGSNYQQVKVLNKGIYGVNNTQWMKGRLNTLAGFRLANSFAQTMTQGSVPTVLSPTTGATKLSIANTFSFDVGANYAVRPWLRPYFSFSDSYTPPLQNINDPYGISPKTAHAIGQEVGIKVQNEKGTLSGSLAVYHVSSKNEQYTVTSTLLNDINPAGLNGRFGASPSVWLNIDRNSQGLQVALTASPVEDWRMRLSAAFISGTIGNSTSYAQVYNDQFHQDKAGNVTYADGTLVYVNPTFNANQLTVPSGTPGAIPLTVTAMSTPGNVYYANPVAITGQINSSSNAARVLAVVDPVHGAILTGATGLPISAMQINPGFTPPGTIPTSVAGNFITGAPRLSLNLTNVYIVPSGWLKGFRLGGSALLGWQYHSYYYYPNGVAVGASRALFDFPTQVRFDLITGYERRFSRLTWSTQFNVTNLFNRYHVLILPNFVSGWAGPLNATFDQQPRVYSWTNTLKF